MWVSVYHVKCLVIAACGVTEIADSAANTREVRPDKSAKYTLLTQLSTVDIISKHDDYFWDTCPCDDRCMCVYTTHKLNK